MVQRTSLHWSAIVLAVCAATWALLSFVGSLVFLMPLLGLAGFILLTLHVRQMEAHERTPGIVGALLGLILYGVWILLTLASQSISIKNVGNMVPPAMLSDAATSLGAYLPALTAIALVLGFWPVWTTRDRAIGAIGGALVVFVQIVALFGVGGDDAMGTLFTALFSLGFVGLLVALVLPLANPDGAHHAWRRPEAS